MDMRVGTRSASCVKEEAGPVKEVKTINLNSMM